MTHYSGLSPSGLICCYAMSPEKLTQKSFGYTPSVFLATGIVNLYTVMGLPACSGWTAVPQGSSVLACWLAPIPLLCLFNVARQWTVVSWPLLLLRYESMVIDMLSLVICPPFAWHQGSLTYILSWACQLAMVGLRYLRVPQFCGVQGL